MLRALLLLSFVGGALYAGLVATHASLSPNDTPPPISDASDDYSVVLAILPPAGNPLSGALRSWGPTLQALRSKPQAPQGAPQPGIDTDNRPVQAGLAVAAASPTHTAQDERIGWAKVALAARGHDHASVSSPVTQFFRAGSELEIVGRDGAWIELRDPATEARGWVFDKYVAIIDAPSATQVATAEPEPAPAVEAVAPKPMKVAAAKSKKSGRSVKPQATTAMLLAKADAERAGVARSERRGLGLFLFGRRLAKLDAEGRVAAR